MAVVLDDFLKLQNRHFLFPAGSADGNRLFSQNAIGVVGH
jgi:hypothetical protein